MERGRFRIASVWVTVAVLVLIVLVFAVMRVATDAGNLRSAELPPRDDFSHRYAAHPWLAYTHIAPGVVYLTLAPLQLWRGFRTRHLRWHRRIGRVVLPAGTVAGVFAIVFGLLWSWGGWPEASATVVFGAWFVTSLAIAFRSIRAGNVREHRRWMIRAFAMGLAVGTIRIWVGVFQGLGLLSFRDSFGVAFWLAFSAHAAAAELWLRWRPAPDGYAKARASTATAPNSAAR